MVDEKEQLVRFLDSDLYKKSLNWQLEHGCRLCPLDRELAVTLEMKALTASRRNVEELIESLEAEPQAFNRFVEGKLSVLKSDDEEEYPPGEEVPLDERAKTVKSLGYPETFLVAHLCEFTLLRQAPEELEAYAKRYRIPKAKKYAKTVTKCFNEAREKARQ